MQLEGLTSDPPSIVDRSDIKGSIQVKQNRSPLRMLGNFVDEDVQVFTNRGGVRVENNVIGGNKEDQCRRF